MSNNYWEDEDDDTLTTPEQGLSSNDNDLVRQLRKADRAKEKRIKELESELVGFKKVQSERTIKEILEQEGVKPSAAKYILKDIENVTPDSIKEWLRDNGEDFGWQPATASKVSDEDRAAISKQDRITQGAITPDRGEDLEMRIDQASSPEELRRILYSE